MEEKLRQNESVRNAGRPHDDRRRALKTYRPYRHISLVVALCASLTVAAACGGGGGDDETPGTTPAATEQPFNRELLTSAVVRAEDLPDGFEGGGVYNPADASIKGTSFSTDFSNGRVNVTSSVAKYPDGATAQEMYVSSRRVVASYGNREENYAIPGADEAVIFRIPRPSGMLSWALTGEYVVLVQMAALDLASPDPFARDEEAFQRLAATVVERVNALQADATNITPLPDLAKTPRPTVTFTGG